MKKKSGCFRSVLVIICVFVIVVIFRACTLKASAANQFELTLEETLAAYGLSFDGSYYNIDTGKTTTLNFKYMGDTVSFLSDSQAAEGMNIGFHGVSPTSESLAGWQDLPPCLVYMAEVPGGIVPCGGDPYNRHTNVLVRLPVEFENVGAFRQQIFWSGHLNENNQTGTYCTLSETKVLTSFGQQVVNPMFTGWQNYNQQFDYGVWSPYSLKRYNFDESKLAYMQRYNVFSFNSVDYSNLFDIYRIDCQFNSCGSVDLTGLKLDGVRYWGGIEGFFVLIGCPVLYYTDRTPIVSPVTTAPYETAVTGIGTTETGINLDSISGDMAEIIRNQRWQIRQNDIMISNQGVQNDNLIRILTRLNDIYTRLLADGNLSPELVPSDNIAPLPQDIQEKIHTALRGTWPTMPSNGFGEAPAVFGELFDLFRDPAFTMIFTLGLISLSLSVAGWFLFKGRN